MLRCAAAAAAEPAATAAAGSGVDAGDARAALTGRARVTEDRPAPCGAADDLRRAAATLDLGAREASGAVQAAACATASGAIFLVAVATGAATTTGDHEAVAAAIHLGGPAATTATVLDAGAADGRRR